MTQVYSKDLASKTSCGTRAGPEASLPRVGVGLAGAVLHCKVTPS